MDNLKEYIKNIDFEIIDDPEVLYNVYSEMEGHEEELMLHPETTYQMENLIRKSNSNQILGMIKKLDIGAFISKKLGSRMMEVVYDIIFDMIYVRGMKIDITPLINPVEDVVEYKFSDTNATHVIRKLFQLVSGKRITKNDVERFNPVLPGRIEEYKDRIIRLVPNISKEDSFITLLFYLRCYRSQSIIYEATKYHFTWMSVCKPSTSYFFENLVKLAGRKTRTYMFEMVGDKIMDLCKDEYANYFIGELILHHHEKADYFFNVIDLSEFDKNSNITMKLVQSLQKIRSYQNINEIVRRFYLSSDDDDIISCTFGGVEGNFKQKYAPMLCSFMKFPDEYNYDVNLLFKNQFNVSWIRSRGGIELLYGYYKGTDDNRSKREFTKRIQKYLPSMTKRKECIPLLKLMMKYTNIHHTELIKQNLR